MACFLVPAAEAVVTTVAAKVIQSQEKKDARGSVTAGGDAARETNLPKIKFSTKLGWLNRLLWGGSALLAFEHAWHGEIVPFFPFLTAVENGETAGMLAEMSSVGVTMALLATAAWGGMLAVTAMMEKRERRDAEALGEAR